MNFLAKALQAQYEKDFAQAQENFSAALQNEADNPETWYYSALFEAQLNHLSQAKNYLLHALQMTSISATLEVECYLALGNIEKKLGNIEVAKKYFFCGLAIDENHVELQNSVGVIYYQQKNFDIALRHFAKATHLKPDYVQAHFNLGLLFIQQGKFDFALKQFHNVLNLMPDFLPAARYLGDLYLQQQDYQLAQHYYHQALSLEEDADILNNLGVTHLKQDDFETASQYFAQAIIADEKHIDARNNLAALYLQDERYDNAARNYYEVLALSPEDVEANYNLGVAQMAIGKLKNAIKQFKKVLQLNPDNLDAQINLAAVFVKLRKANSAIKLYKKILQQQPEHPIAAYMLSALTGLHLDAAPPQYVENLFDNYAGFYEKHMQEVLHYSVPQVMQSFLKPYVNPPELILDLGCGSGLVGHYFQAIAKQITGIDLSKKMLLLAQKRKVYHELIHADLVQGMTQISAQFSLIIAADTLVYVGDLSKVFEQSARLLKSKGLFCFSIEQNMNQRDFKLLTTARFAHSSAYIEHLAHMYNMTILIQEDFVPRLQDEAPISGKLFLLQKD